MKLVSPNDIMSQAKDQMLGGREPTTTQDWFLVVNFLAFNVDAGCAHMAVKFMCQLYDIPLTPSQVEEVINHQLANRNNQ